MTIRGRSMLGLAVLGALLATAPVAAQSLGGGDRDPGSSGPSGNVNSAALADPYDYDALIVGYKTTDARGSGDLAAVAAHLDSVGRSTGQSLFLERTLSTGGQLVKLSKPLDDARLLQVMKALAADPSVAYVEVDQRMEAYLTPNDTSYSQQWHYFEATAGANVSTAWDTATGTGVTVAVLDTGITSHTDLNANMVAGYDFVSSASAARDGDGRDSNPADQGDWTAANQCKPSTAARNSSWHGTHVAGTIAAVTNNASGVAGVAFNARVQAVRVLAVCGGSLSDIADAITWASGGTVTGIPANATPANIINMSLGGPSSTCPSTYQTAINGAVGRGTAVIVAAGNDNINASGATPANCASVITVAATNRLGGKASYSNFGTSVDLAAPGGDVTTGSTNGILSTLNTGTTTPVAQGYAWFQGTSMAAPHVAGVAALVMSRAAQTPAALETLLKANVRAFPAACSQCGTGITNAAAAVAAAGGGSFFENTADFAINDNITIESPISVVRSGNAPTTLRVGVTIFHTYQGDLKVDLVAPDGSVYVLHNRTGTTTDNIIGTYTVNASSELAQGTWRLRVNDNAAGDVGRLDKWSLQF